MLIINNDALHTFQANVYDAFNIIEALVCGSFAPGLLEVEPQVLNAPFGPMISIVLVCFLLDGNIRQVHRHVVHFGHV